MPLKEWLEMKATRKLYAIGKEHFARQLLYTRSPRVKRFCIDSNGGDIILLLHSWFAFRLSKSKWVVAWFFCLSEYIWTLTLVIYFFKEFDYIPFWVKFGILSMKRTIIFSHVSILDSFILRHVQLTSENRQQQHYYGYSVSASLCRHHQQQQLRWK